MSKLLARAKVKFSNACYNYTRMGEDDAFLDEACYNLQQTIELSLKYLVEMNGENFDEESDINIHLSKLKKLNAKIPCEEKIFSMTSTINTWSIQPRINDSFTATIEDINQVKEIAESLINYCDGLVKIEDRYNA